MMHRRVSLPEDSFGGGLWDGHLGGELESVSPVHDLAVSLLRGLRAEGRVAYQHLEHDDPQGPPVTALVVAGLQENLGRDIVRGAHGGVRQGSPVHIHSRHSRSRRWHPIRGSKAKASVSSHRFLFQLSAFLFESMGLEEKSEGLTCVRSWGAPPLPPDLT